VIDLLTEKDWRGSDLNKLYINETATSQSNQRGGFPPGVELRQISSCVSLPRFCAHEMLVWMKLRNWLS